MEDNGEGKCLSLIYLPSGSPAFPDLGWDGGWKPPLNVSDQKNCKTWFFSSKTFPASLIHVLMFGVHAPLPTSTHKETRKIRDVLRFIKNNKKQQNP